jgi:hypothetical protein
MIGCRNTKKTPPATTNKPPIVQALRRMMDSIRDMETVDVGRVESAAIRTGEPTRSKKPTRIQVAAGKTERVERFPVRAVTKRLRSSPKIALKHYHLVRNGRRLN